MNISVLFFAYICMTEFYLSLSFTVVKCNDIGYIFIELHYTVACSHCKVCVKCISILRAKNNG